MHDQVQVLTSEPILKEYADLLRDMGRDQEALHLAESWITFVFHHAAVIDVRTRIDACRDPDDNKYLECAVDGGADFIVSGDNDLLSLELFQGIPIVKPRRFVDIAAQTMLF